MIAWTSSWPCICWPTHLSPCPAKYSYMDFTFFNSSCFYYFIVASSCSRTGSLNLLAFNMANYALILFSYCYWDWVRWKNTWIVLFCLYVHFLSLDTSKLNASTVSYVGVLEDLTFWGAGFEGGYWVGVGICEGGFMYMGMFGWVWGLVMGVALGGWDWCVAFWGKRLAGVLRVGWYSKILHIIKLYKYT